MELLTQTGKRKREEGEEKETERCNNYWCHLPPNFICSLLYYVSPKTACALKATCKAWNRARLLLPVPIGSPSSPCHSSPAIMITYKHKKKKKKGTDALAFKFFHPMNRESFHGETEKFVVRWLDIDRWEWHPVQLSDLRDKILYLSSERSFVQCDDTTKGKGNRIYVLGFLGYLKHYSLETDKYLDVDKEFLSYQHLFTHGTWIIPADCCSC